MGSTLSNSKHSGAVVAKSSVECRVETTSFDDVASSVWFSSPPIKESTLRRLKSVQLVTVGHFEDTASPEGSKKSWFELAVCRPSKHPQPRANLATNTELAWRSHDNSSLLVGSRCEGQVFTRSHALLKELETGDTIAVRLCVQHGPGVSRGTKGQVIFVTEDDDTPEIEPAASELYPFSSTGPLAVQATDHYVSVKLWFSTPPLDQECISSISEIQLFTRSRDQGWVSDPDSNSYSWFELVILAESKDQLPVLRDGHYLAWRSHHNPVASTDLITREGKIFGRSDEICGLLRPGDCLGVRAASQFGAWANYAHEGRLEIRFSSPLFRRKGLTRMRNIVSEEDFLSLVKY